MAKTFRAFNLVLWKNNNFSFSYKRSKDQDQAPRYKTFFMLNSAEHEIFSAYKSQIPTFVYNNCKFFLAKCS